MQYSPWRSGLLGMFVISILFGVACTRTDTVYVDKATTQPPASSPTVTPIESDAPKEVAKDLGAPIVASINPADQTSGAALGTEVSVTFSEDVRPETVNTQSLVLKDSSGVVVSSSVFLDVPNKIAILKPEKHLADGETYSVDVLPAITDLSGNALASSYHATFKTSNMPTTMIAAGWSHSAAVKSNGTLWMWGRNNYGQLGNGSTFDQKRPIRVKELSDVVSVSAGFEFTLALGADRTVWAWGRNARGQLGDGSTVDHHTPVRVSGLSDVVAITAALRSGYALKSDGTVWAWGANERGQLGNGNSVDQPFPVKMMLPDNVKAMAISAGQNYVMVLTEDDSEPAITHVYTCGGNFFGQLGNGSVSSSTQVSSKPAPVVDGSNLPIEGIRTIASSGLMSYAITSDNRLLGWGIRGAGNGTTTNQPFALEIMKNVQDVGRGVNATHQFAITTDGELWGWGNNASLQLMQYDPNLIIPSPVQIGTFRDAKAAATGVNHSVILKSDGSVITAGSNVYAELGDGSASFYSHYPNKVTSLPPAIQISGRSALTTSGKVFAWGRNVDCELGLPNEGAEIMSPVPIKGIPDKVIQISRSGTHMLALTDKGQVWAWGSNHNGQLGTGLPQTALKSCIPTRVKGQNGIDNLENVFSIYAVNYYVVNPPTNRSVSYALQKDAQGNVVTLAWGDNAIGQLGSGGGSNFNNLPKVVSGVPNNVAEISGLNIIYARTVDNHYYKISANPEEVFFSFGEAHVKHFSGGTNFTLALLDNGQVWSWGVNNFGQLGLASSLATIDTPTQISALSQVVAINAHAYNSAAITEAGVLYVWGNNSSGQLGNGSSTMESVPVQVFTKEGLPLLVKDVSIAYSGTTDFSGVYVALQKDGTVWDWGFMNVKPTMLIKEGEPAFRSSPTTVNWP